MRNFSTLTEKYRPANLVWQNDLLGLECKLKKGIRSDSKFHFTIRINNICHFVLLLSSICFKIFHFSCLQPIFKNLSLQVTVG